MDTIASVQRTIAAGIGKHATVVVVVVVILVTIGVIVVVLVVVVVFVVTALDAVITIGRTIGYPTTIASCISRIAA
jgi:hypothetical protein